MSNIIGKLSLKESILASLSYFNIFDYPLTLSEIHRFLYKADQGYGISEVEKELENSSEIESKNGFYFLKDREIIVQKRLKRYLLAKRKFKKALLISRFLSFIPYIRLIAVSNTLSYSNAGSESDIDLFIITAPNRLWLTRFLVIAPLKLLRQRPKTGKAKDKICLSFFISEDNLNLKEISLREDIYLVYWIASLVPLYNANKTYERFLKSNQWVKECLPNFLSYETSLKRKIKEKKKKEKKYFFNFMEIFFYWLQRKIMPEKLKRMANQDTRVVINKQMVKLFDEDKREEYRDKWLFSFKKFI